MGRRLYMETFGCQMNVLDTQLVLGRLRAEGYELAESVEQADVVLYNTCSVRQHAEQKVWSRLGRLRGEKKRRPELVIGVMGCMAEREGAGMFERHPQVDVLCGPAELDKLPGLLERALAKAEGMGRQVALMGSRDGGRPAQHGGADGLEQLDLSRSVSGAEDVSQAYVRITRGCNKFCSYCVVPYTRGPEVHRPPGNIMEEVRRLAGAGAREVTLLGQTVNRYAYRHGDGRTTSFAELLSMVHEAAPGLARLRFVTSYPRDFTDEALAAMRDCSWICGYLHVPAQSGSDRILKMMNRGYTVGEYRELVERARSMVSDVSIASDFIVGFPTETEEDHEASMELIRHCRFKNSFVFKYSARPGTMAAKRYKDDIPEAVKRRRNSEVLAVQQTVCLENNRQMIGKRVAVIVEGQSKLASRQGKSDGEPVQLTVGGRRAGQTQLIARARGDQIVCFDGLPELKGRILSLEIVGAEGLTLFGRLAGS